MLVILYESLNSIDSVLDKVVKKADQSIVFTFYKRKLSTVEMQQFTHKPLLANSWVIIIRNSRFDKKQVEELAKTNVVFWQVTDISSLKQVQSKFNDGEYKLINNSKFEKQQVKEWIIKTLGCKEAIATSIYNRADGYIDYIVDTVDTLSKVFAEPEAISRSELYKVMAPVSKIKRYDLFNYIFLKHTKYRELDLVEYLSNYRNRWQEIKNYLVTEASEYIEIFQYQISGELNHSNVESFLKGKELKIPVWKVNMMLDEHERISMQSLISKRIFIQELTDTELGACILADTIINLNWRN